MAASRTLEDGTDGFVSVNIPAHEPSADSVDVGDGTVESPDVDVDDGTVESSDVGVGDGTVESPDVGGNAGVSEDVG